MKPRLKKIGRIWLCYTQTTIVCTGLTPEEAYQKWMIKNKAAE
jgi:hypothetical protein